MVKGRVFKFGDDVNTDVIIPARYLNDPSLENMAKHCMEDIDPEFPKQDHTGDIMVGGWNFGCGSSREHAPVSIYACGVSCVIAASFARILYRNAINIGFPILECPEAAEAIDAGDTVSVDFETGTIIDETTGQEFKAAAFPPFIQKIIKAGGLINYRKEEGKAKNEL